MSTVEGWIVVEVQNLASQTRHSFIDGDWIEAPHITNAGIRLIQTGNIGIGVFVNNNKKFISEVSFTELKCKDVYAGDILICRLADPIGRSCIVPDLNSRAITSVDVCILRVDGKKYDPDCIAHALNQRTFLDACQEYSGGSTRQRISRTNLGKLKLLIPESKTEQIKIAEILSTVDRAIEQTEAIIAKQQRIKTGLMQGLLTRGIDERGNIRSEETHEFKDSPLGRIPVEWEVKRLSELVDEGITYGIVQAGPNIENGVPYIRTGDMAGETINAAQLLKTSERIAKSYKRSAVFSGDIIFALRATVGKVLPVSKELEGSNLTQGTAKISPKKSIESTFLLWALQTALVQDQIRLHQKGTAFMEITLADLRSIEVALPIMQDEQSSISEKLTKHDDLRLQYIKNRQKLRALKTALMHDLLTGEVRVTPLLFESQEVSA